MKFIKIDESNKLTKLGYTYIGNNMLLTKKSYDSFYFFYHSHRIPKLTNLETRFELYYQYHVNDLFFIFTISFAQHIKCSEYYLVST
jgi:hypothetical protein